MALDSLYIAYSKEAKSPRMPPGVRAAINGLFQQLELPPTTTPTNLLRAAQDSRTAR